MMPVHDEFRPPAVFDIEGSGGSNVADAIKPPFELPHHTPDRGAAQNPEHSRDSDR